MEKENQPNQKPPVSLSSDLWERVVSEADDDVKKALTLAKTNEHDVLLAVRKVAQEKRSQAIWKCWGEERTRGQTVILPVRDVLEKLIRYVDLIRDRNPSIPEEKQSAWRLFWSPFWFLLRAEVQDVQMFSRTTNNLMRAARFFFMFQDCDLGKLLWFSPPEGSAEDLLSRAYAEILRLLAYRVNHAASGEPVVDSEEFDAVRRLLSGIGYACTHFRLPYMRSLDIRCQRPYEKGMIFETVIAQELHEELQSWIFGKPVHVERENLRELSEGSVPDNSPMVDALHKWWTRGCSSILAVADPDFTRLETCREALRWISPPFDGQELLSIIVCINCAECSSSEEILQRIIADLTLSSAEKRTVSDTLLSEYRLRQAVAKEKGHSVSPLTAEDCLSIILDATAANPATILLDGASSSQAEAIFPLLTRAINNSDNILKILLSAAEEATNADPSAPRRKYAIRHAGAAEAIQPHHQPPPLPQPQPQPRPASPLAPYERRTLLLDVLETGAENPTCPLSSLLRTPTLPLPTALATAVLHNRSHLLPPLLLALSSDEGTTSNIDINIDIALRIAAAFNRPRCARLLLSHGGGGADPNAVVSTTSATTTTTTSSATTADGCGGGGGHARMIVGLLRAFGIGEGGAGVAAAAAAAGSMTGSIVRLAAAARDGDVDAVRAVLDEGAGVVVEEGIVVV
ncbi:hypothetical protein SLS58_010562 [Diplodia intermedia]|uniref:Uncharacterized protein n=1 Tax=Diplodia intermedia TaxID=856260 RepID=A0ABR3T567_9PEZI